MNKIEKIIKEFNDSAKGSNTKYTYIEKDTPEEIINAVSKIYEPGVETIKVATVEPWVPDTILYDIGASKVFTLYSHLERKGFYVKSFGMEDNPKLTKGEQYSKFLVFGMQTKEEKEQNQSQLEIIIKVEEGK